MADGNQPFSGGSGPSWNDAMLAAEIRRRQAAGEPIWPELSAEQIERRRRRHGRKAMTWGLVAVFFLIGGFADLAVGRASTSVVPFVVSSLAFGWSRHHRRSARPAR